MLLTGWSGLATLGTRVEVEVGTGFDMLSGLLREGSQGARRSWEEGWTARL